ncbi:hypothetical protein POM88_025846 [Heracleum sosnowskyi]|uniref:Autophagy-related protein 13 N-terminal domain-containing protein n=1 Tax=Heracleum sosnowskyi TaxID=360622 RepID=A0AAD8I4P5_9APIA|nr:hypothetical protein POM88_025846 [Heracleum sosnowskyi]
MDGQSGNSHGEHGRFKQIFSQFLLKILHMILDSRVPSIHPYNRKNDQVKKSDKWFSLVSGDHPAALDNLNFWHRNLMDPMIIDIILVNQLEVFNQHRHILNALIEEIRLIKGWGVKFWNSNFIDRSKVVHRELDSRSRSFSRISFQDDLDDCDFSCPFIVDDVDNSDLQARLFCATTSLQTNQLKMEMLRLTEVTGINGFEAYVLDFHIRKNVNSSPDDRKKRLLKSQISLTKERRKRNITLLVEEVMVELEFDMKD